jgi:hypothetical protein
MSVRRVFLLPIACVLALLSASALPHAQSAPARQPAASLSAVTTPMQEWGHNLGDDYFLVNYQQLMTYWRKLAAQSPRLRLEEIGKTSEGRPMLMGIITSPANHQRIARYKDISRRLANAEGLTDAQARALAAEGKAVVWIDGGLHANETLGAQQLVEHVFRMTSQTDAETMRFLDDVIQLIVLVNPDGMDLVSDWYMKHGNMNIPVMYNKYAGHDDNRDFFMSALEESTNINRVMYRDWIPQIMYNHHQTGPAGTVMFAPPFRDPYNHFQHPYAIAGIDVVGAMMMERFLTEGKAGVTQRRGAPYSTWFNGGIRTTAHFHNIIGILTETIGNPAPTSIPFQPSTQIGDSNLWMPIKPQEWHMRQSVEYSMTANRAILDYASRYREKVLYNIYKMGQDEITWGSEDHWTFTPHKMARVQEQLVAEGKATPRAIPGAASTMVGGRGGRGGGGRGGGGGAVDPLQAAMTSQELRDPRGFIIPSDQPDFSSAVRFVNTLIKTGVKVQRATQPFSVAGKSYPANSFVVKTAQAFRPHVMDMFEPQDHPDDIPYPGGPPTAPYDSTGYTLAFTMGVQFDRILDQFDVPGTVVLTDYAKPPAGVIKSATAPAGYYFTHQSNNSFIVVNRLTGANEEVTWLATGPMGTGTFYVAAKPTTLAILQKAATELGVNFEAAATAPTGAGSKLKSPRIGLYDQYGGGMPSGWTRMILEQFEFAGFTPKQSNLVFPPDLARGNLRASFDVLVFNGGGLPGGGGRGGGGGAAPAAPAAAGAGAGTGGRAAGDGSNQAGRAAGAGAAGAGRGAGGVQGGRANFTPEPIPEMYARRQGQMTPQAMDHVKAFVNEGGTVIYIGNTTAGAAREFGLPLTDQTEGLPNDKFYVPGAVLQVSVDNEQPVAHGMGKQVDVFFDNNPAFKVTGDAGTMRSVAWFPNATPLRSGWAWGQSALDKGVVAVSAKVGQGNVFLFAPEILFRAQPHGTFKLFFNGLYLSVAQPK